MAGFHNKQNWLLITFDQWRGDWLKQPWLNLPQMKKIAREGWHLNRCYTSSPQCVPARVSWLTGQKPKELGLTRNIPYTVSANADTFVRELRDQQGYYTSLIGKTHWTPHGIPGDLRDNLMLLKSLGFDHAVEIAGPRALRHKECELTDLWKEHGVYQEYVNDLNMRYSKPGLICVRPTVLPENLYPDVWIANSAIEEISNLPFDRPWFLWISFVGPHEPFDVPTSWSRYRYIPDPLPRPREESRLDKLAPPGSVLENKILNAPHYPKELIDQARQDYANHLELLDFQVKRIIDRLQFRLDYSNTSITLCSDHGELLGDWGLFAKSCFLEGAIRSLFIHRPAASVNIWQRFRQNTHHRAYGLTECLWAAKNAVSSSSKITLVDYLNEMPLPVSVAYENEEIFIK